MKITVSAPGKLLLLGDHTVVYGQPCLVTAVSAKIRVTLSQSEGDTVSISTPEIDRPVVKPLDKLFIPPISYKTRFIENAIKLFFNKYKINSGINIETETEDNFRYGLGSSAAVSVATIYGLSTLFNKNLTLPQIFESSYQSVYQVQGLGSGFDVAASTFGGVLYYVTPGKILERLKVNDLPLLVAYSGQKADTVTLVKQVADKFKSNPKKAQKIKLACGRLVEQAKRALLEKDWQSLGEYMNMNQQYLQDLGVSTEKLDLLISAALKAGAFGAKLSGAGGGDCMIVLAGPDQRRAVISALVKAGGQVLNLNIQSRGVKIEKNNKI